MGRSVQIYSGFERIERIFLINLASRVRTRIPQGFFSNHRVIFRSVTRKGALILATNLLKNGIRAILKNNKLIGKQTNPPGTSGKRPIIPQIRNIKPNTPQQILIQMGTLFQNGHVGFL